MPKIILIDDDDSCRKTLKYLLELEGHTVLLAENGKQALPLCKDPDIDLVITDIVMPEMEGLETIRAIRKLRPTIKVVAMSGGGRVTAEDYLKIAGKLGADETLVKPFNRSQLRKAVETVLPEQGAYKGSQATNRAP